MSEHESTTVEMRGNAAGWVGVRPVPQETPDGDVTLEESMEPYESDLTLRGLKAGETVIVTVEAGENRVERRVVSDGYGRVHISFEGDPATAGNSRHDATFSVDAGDTEAVITFEGQYAEQS